MIRRRWQLSRTRLPSVRCIRAALGQRAQLSRADIALQHLVYQQKYAKQKEAGK